MKISPREKVYGQENSVLIIGGCGYIGSKVYQHLSTKYDVDTVDLEWFGNFNNPQNICIDYKDISWGFLSKYKTIVLLAGHSSVKMCEKDYRSVFDNNVRNFVHMLGNLRSYSTKLIYASSSSVYGNIDLKNVDETCSTYKPNNAYDLSKQQIDDYAKLSHQNFYGLRFGTVNGPSPNFRSDVMINAMCTSAKKHGKVVLFNPEISRPILGINDLCRAISAMISDKKENGRSIYNLASFNLTAKEIAEAVAKVANVPLEIHDTPPDIISNVKLQSKAYDFSIDCSKFSESFGFTFKETPESITQDILDEFDSLNVTDRAKEKLYFSEGPYRS